MAGDATEYYPGVPALCVSSGLWDLALSICSFSIFCYRSNAKRAAVTVPFHPVVLPCSKESLASVTASQTSSHGAGGVLRKGISTSTLSAIFIVRKHLTHSSLESSKLPRQKDSHSFERIEGLVFDLPAAARGAHDRLARPFRERQIRHPRPSRHLAGLVRLLVKQVVDFDIRRAVAPAQVFHQGKVMSYTLGISELPFLHLAGRAAAHKLPRQTGVRVWLDVENVVPVGLVDLPHARRVGVEGVFDQDHLQAGITRAQPSQQTLSGVALAIVLGRAEDLLPGGYATGFCAWTVGFVNAEGGVEGGLCANVLVGKHQTSKRGGRKYRSIIPSSDSIDDWDNNVLAEQLQ